MQFKRREERFVFLLLLLLVPTFVIANESISQQSTSNSTSKSIDKQPISINADRQQIDITKNTITFSGHVVVEQNGLTIKGDKVVIANINNKTKQIITAQGSPVYFKQTMQDENKNITGHANKAIYNVNDNLVTLDGNAEVVQQGHQIISPMIVYDVVKQKIEAQPPKNERVKTIIVPAQVKG